MESEKIIDTSSIGGSLTQIGIYEDEIFVANEDSNSIYFMDKNSENAVSVLYSLDEFELSKKENLEKEYLLGRYGAIPFLQTEELI